MIGVLDEALLVSLKTFDKLSLFRFVANVTTGNDTAALLYGIHSLGYNLACRFNELTCNQDELPIPVQ